MRKIKSLLFYFSKMEILLWSISAFGIMVAFLIFDRERYLTLVASLIGITSLIFNAKGNPLGQLLMIVFSVLYGIISWEMSYYGEMIAYLGMTTPMALYALIAWLRHPFDGNKAEVRINKLKPMEYIIMTIVTVLVTLIFYNLLVYFNTANIIPSTISVSTSFIAVYLTARRSEYYAIGYAANDVVLIILWIMASKTNTSYVSVAVCFVVFLFNDLYGFYNWAKMKKRQQRLNA